MMGENIEAIATIELYIPKLKVLLSLFSLSNTKIAGGTKPIDNPNKSDPTNIHSILVLSITKIRQLTVKSIHPNTISVFAFNKFQIENNRVTNNELMNVIITILMSFVDSLILNTINGSNVVSIENTKFMKKETLNNFFSFIGFLLM